MFGPVSTPGVNAGLAVGFAGADVEGVALLVEFCVPLVSFVGSALFSTPVD